MGLNVPAYGAGNKKLKLASLGLKSITADNDNHKVIMELADGSKQELTFDALRELADVEKVEDSNEIEFVYSDGTKSEPISIPTIKSTTHYNTTAEAEADIESIIENDIELVIIDDETSESDIDGIKKEIEKLEITTTAKQLGLESYPINNLATSVHLNKLKPIARANTEKLNQFLAKNINASIVIEFGTEAYAFDDTIDLTRNNGTQFVTLKGDNYTNMGASLSANSTLDGYNDIKLYSGLYFIPSESNKTFIDSNKGGMNVVGLSIITPNFVVKKNAYSSVGTMTMPYTFIETNAILDNINGIKINSNTSLVKDCYIRGFSGYGVKTAQACKINNLKIIECNVGIDFTETDANITDCYITSCYYAYKSNASWTVNFIYNAWIDQCVYGIYSDGWISGRFTGLIDHCDGAGIYAELKNYLIDARMGRCGAKLVDTAIDDLVVDSTNETTFAESYKDYAFIASKKIRQSQLRISAYQRGLDDYAPNAHLLPNVLIASKYIEDAVIDVPYDGKYKMIADGYTTYNNVTVISDLPSKIASLEQRIEALEN